MAKTINYVESESKDGSFSYHIKDKKLVKKIDTICIIKRINKTHYITNIIRENVEKEILELQEREKNKEK